MKYLILSVMLFFAVTDSMAADDPTGIDVKQRSATVQSQAATATHDEGKAVAQLMSPEQKIIAGIIPPMLCMLDKTARGSSDPAVIVVTTGVGGPLIAQGIYELWEKAPNLRQLIRDLHPAFKVFVPISLTMTGVGYLYGKVGIMLCGGLSPLVIAALQTCVNPRDKPKKE